MSYTLASQVWGESSPFFSEQNVKYVQDQVLQKIKCLGFNICITKDNIIRVMQRIYDQGVRSVEDMDAMVIHELVQDFKNYTIETQRANDWACNRWNALVYDSNLCLKNFDTPKLRGDRVLRQDARPFEFHFTY